MGIPLICGFFSGARAFFGGPLRILKKYLILMWF
jgi:hypothetical protein